jgi:hypothetical protein
MNPEAGIHDFSPFLPISFFNESEVSLRKQLMGLYGNMVYQG